MKKVLFAGILIALFLTDCGNKPIEIKITYPNSGSVVKGMVMISTEIVSDGSVTRVEFFIDDSLEYTALSEPYVCLWSTFFLIENSSHRICVIAWDRDVRADTSDTTTVTVNNGATLFADDFEYYFEGKYPARGGWYQIWEGADSTYVQSGIAYEGNKSFRLTGSSELPRADGIELSLSGVKRLTYEFAIMIPNSSTGALIGFFVRISPTLGEVFNGVLFAHADKNIYVRGTTPQNTGYPWYEDTWYCLRVELDYDSLRMDVWLDNQQIANDLQAAPRDTSHTFVVATEYQGGGVVYYDNIVIYKK